MRKPTICICENKGADQLRSNCEADLRLCFRYTYRTIPLFSKFKNFQPLAILCACTAGFVSELVKNPCGSNESKHAAMLINGRKHNAMSYRPKKMKLLWFHLFYGLKAVLSVI